MITNEAIIELVEQQIRESDIFLVDVAVKAGNVIRIHVDRPDGISIDECVKISRHVNEMLDRDVEDFSLEVSSPGLGSSFKVKQQYEKNTGHKIDVLLSDGTRITGKLQSVSDSGIVLQVKGNDREIEFEEIKTSKALISFN
ncbi:MAG: ribosome assembly cofactor RimP [Bacteroidales bacterium]|nr:ribosome assembly cofactor RimP [Bacteroidales bacterium]